MYVSLSAQVPWPSALSEMDSKMDFDTKFRTPIADMKLDDRYRSFIELKRIMPTPFHTEAHMRDLVDALIAVREQLGWSVGQRAA